MFSASVALETGSRSALPIDPRRAFQPNGSAPPTTTTPLAPPASAARITAPVFPGFCTSSRPSTSAGFALVVDSNVALRSLAIATRPLGEDTGLSARITEGDTFTTRVRPTSWSTRPPQSPWDVETLTAASSICAPAERASLMSLGPSRSTAESSGAVPLATSLNRATMGFWRLVISDTIWPSDRAIQVYWIGDTPGGDVSLWSFLKFYVCSMSPVWSVFQRGLRRRYGAPRHRAHRHASLASGSIADVLSLADCCRPRAANLDLP